VITVAPLPRTPVLGIDPGITGALALLAGDEPPRVWDMPTREVEVGRKRRTRICVAGLLATISQAVALGGVSTVAYVERSQASPQMGVSSAFAYGEGFGILEGILAALGVPLRPVMSWQWKRGLGLIKPGSRTLGRNEARDKRPALHLARRLYPGLAPMLKREKDNGRAEALLIAHWGCEQIEGALFARANPTEATA
jgi:crossover junction endodeoxyribonuclease RuvC